MLQPEVPVSSNGKRTNSLAFCRTDCHTCSSLGQNCDRQRPRCSTCLSQGRKCGGFVTPLSWATQRMWTENPSGTEGAAKNATHSVPNQNGWSRSTSASHKPCPSRQFRFVMGASKPRKRRKTASASQRENAPPSQSPLEDRPSPTDGDISATTAEDSQFQINGQRDTHPPDGLGNSDLAVPSPNPAEFLGDDLNPFDSIWSNSFSPIPFFGLDKGEPSTAAISTNMRALSETPPFNAMETTEQNPPLNRDPLDPLIQDLNSTFAGSTQSNLLNSIPNDLRIQEINMPSGSLPNNALGLSNIFRNDHDNLLQMYDAEFCVLPLTSDITVNPFRCQPQTSQGSRLLFHSILALCCQHLYRLTGSWSTEAVKHRSKAAQLLECALQNEESRNKFHLLEPILIMFTLDCTLSAIGTWSTHLTRAHSILQACGGPSALSNPRVRSQVAMLVWWDATLALISRQGPIISRAYLELLARWEKEDEWTFFDLTGCPRDLLIHLYELAEVALQKEIASSMKWLSFDMTPVIETERKIVGWTNVFTPLTDADDDDEEEDGSISSQQAESQFHDQQDRYHCAEAWRYALLLYIERVFKYGGHQRRRPRSISRLVRLTLDHVRCGRRTSQTQKQLLLPVFLAGSETTDEDMRDLVKEYCRYWAEKTRYEMFGSVPVLLEEIWSVDGWWGSVIDKKTRSTTPGPVVGTQFLFG